jgi:large subunit ribosomal protein L9
MATKVLLIEDVEDLGRSGDIVNVREGFARNFIIPRGLGVKADKNAIRRQAALQEARLKKAAEDKAESEKLANVLNTLTIITEVKVDHEGHMYGSVAQQDIVQLLKDQHHVDVDKHFIKLKQPIKKIGTHHVEFKLKEGVVAALVLKVFAEGTVTEEAAEVSEA